MNKSHFPDDTYTAEHRNIKRGEIPEYEDESWTDELSDLEIEKDSIGFCV